MVGKGGYSEDAVVSAYLEVHDDGISTKKATQRYGIPRTTLRDQLHGVSSKADMPQPQQRLSPVQETRLTTWILRQENLGYTPSHSQVRNIVKALLKSIDDHKPLGKNWIDGFKHHNP